MHLISNYECLYDEKGEFCGCKFEMSAIFTDNLLANTMVYQEIWHRMRRDMLAKSLFHGEVRLDAAMYTSGSPTEKGDIRATAIINRAETRVFDPDYLKDSEKNMKRIIRRLDRLVYKLIIKGPNLDDVAEKFRVNQEEATTELKSRLKFFARRNGLFVDDTDVDRANKQAKARRRERYLTLNVTNVG